MQDGVYKDQAILAEEGVGEEMQKAKVPRKPHEPSRLEIEEHEDTGHVVFRDWCPECIAAKGLGHPHRAIKDEEETALPTVSMDYAYMSEKKEDVYPMLVIADRKSGSIAINNH